MAMKKYLGYILFVIINISLWAIFDFEKSIKILSKIAGCNLYIFCSCAFFEFMREEFYSFFYKKKQTERTPWILQLGLASSFTGGILMIILFYIRK